MKNLAIILLLSLLCVIPVGVRAQNLEFVSEMEFPNSNLKGVYAAGCYAYVASGGYYHRALRIIDISDPYIPYIIGQLDSNTISEAVQVEGQYAYLTWTVDYSLKVVDVSNSAQPLPVGGSAGPNYESHGVFINKSLCYLAGCGQGLRIFDISDPPNPVQIGSYDSLWGYMAHGVWVAGPYAYLAEWRGGLWIINVSNPYFPTYVGHFMGGEWWYSREVTVSGNYAYMSSSGDSVYGLLVIDVSDRSNPRMVSLVPNPSGFHSVYVRGQYLYAGGGRHLKVFNISNPVEPALVAACSTSTGIYDVFLSGNLVLIVGGARFAIYRFSPTGMDESIRVGNEFALSLAYPNPFNASTTISYSLPEPGHVTLSIYNITGQRVATLVDGVQQAGEHRVVWEAGKMTSGVYFYRLASGGQEQTGRMILLR